MPPGSCQMEKTRTALLVSVLITKKKDFATAHGSMFDSRARSRFFSCHTWNVLRKKLVIHAIEIDSVSIEGEGAFIT